MPSTPPAPRPEHADPTADDTSPAPERVIRVSAVVMRDDAGRVLNVRKRGTAAFMLPGGKPEPGETAAATALREFSEELGIGLDAGLLEAVGVFRSAAANEPGFVVEAAVFRHPLVAEALAAEAHAEIEAIEWIDPAAVRGDLAPLNVDHVFPALIKG